MPKKLESGDILIILEPLENGDLHVSHALIYALSNLPPKSWQLSWRTII